MGYANKPELAVVGIETSKLHLKAVLLRDGELLCKVLENDMAGYRWLRSWLQKNEVDVTGLRVCLRLDAPHSDIAARSLALMGMQVCDAPPAELAQFARGSGLDAQGMGAVLLAIMRPPGSRRAGRHRLPPTWSCGCGCSGCRRCRRCAGRKRPGWTVTCRRDSRQCMPC